jgi:hypothetical protein
MIVSHVTSLGDYDIDYCLVMLVVSWTFNTSFGFRSVEVRYKTWGGSKFSFM